MKKVLRTNWFFLILIIYQMIVGTIISVPLENYKLPFYKASTIIYLIAFLIPIVIYFIITQESPKETLKLNSISFIDVVMIIALAVFFQPILMLLSAITSIFFPNAAGEVILKLSKVPLVIQIMIIAVIPAFFEEFVMRGIILSGYKDKTVLKTIIVNGIFFAILHMNLQQSLYAFIMGMILAYLVIITKSIFSSVICHFSINAIQVILANHALKVEQKNIDISKIHGEIKPELIRLMIYSAIVIIPIIFLFKKLKERNYLKNKNKISLNQSMYDYTMKIGIDENDKIINKPFIILIIFYVLFIIISLKFKLI